ncbi:EAL domain-containing protein [Novosphingobium huizhouense]|uniref:EAL domain-containing protein n=1 Tax=Novosphingobium huizhouense TaxID=2866625 RepID=UPI001CD87130|nr:EAL domain-containing protein [Novosphingobium huizhouense]
MALTRLLRRRGASADTGTAPLAVRAAPPDLPAGHPGGQRAGDRAALPVADSAADPAARAELVDALEASGRLFLWSTDGAGRLLYLSPGAAARLGARRPDLVGSAFAHVFATDPETAAARADRPLQFVMTARQRIDDLVVRLAPDAAVEGAAVSWWSLSAEPAFGSEGEFLGHRGTARDVTADHLRRIEDARLAEFDTLTGLGNRHRLNRRLDQILAAYRAAGRPCALVMLDLDRFKQVNDTLGHPAGDELLQQVAQRLRKVIGDRGEIGRLGGDEFQVLLPDLEDRGVLGELAGRVIGLLSQPYLVGGDRAVIGASLGIAVAPHDGNDREALTHAADLALYAAKNGGRGAYRFYSADLTDEKEERRAIEEALRCVLDTDALELHYQPVVRTADHTVVGFEALLRWDDGERGPIGPQVFVPIAEECGLIHPLGEWVLRNACRDALAWPETVRVAVNVSAVQFADPQFPDTVGAILAETGIAPERLELELTETIFLGDDERTQAAFAQLKALGVRLVLDDFGTGYSSLSYLRQAPFDKLKVDRAFVDACTLRDSSSAKIIAAIIGLAEALGMETVVEGVEAFDQFHLVCDKGASLVQGYLYSPPLPLGETLDRIAAAAFRIAPSGPQRHRPERRAVYRGIGLIHEDHRYEAVMKDLSATGARIDGLVGVPVGTRLVLDLGAGQLAVCTVVRAQEATIGVEFETPLVSDGAGGLVTRHRVSPAALRAALAAVPAGPRHFLEVSPTGALSAGAGRA